MKVRQHNRSQSCLVTVRIAVDKQRNLRLAVNSIVHWVVLCVRHLGLMVTFDPLFIHDAEKQVGKVVIKGRANVETRKQRQIEHLGQCLAETENRLAQVLRQSIERKCSAPVFPIQSFLLHDALKERSSGTDHKRINIVFVANMHQCMAPV